jgi:small conductance mechanosensitive channel
MRRVADELRRDPAHGPLILEPIEILGVDAFKDTSVVIKARLKTLPIQQWTVGREYRRRLVLAFSAEGIEVPSRMLQVAEPGKPLSVLLVHGEGGGEGGTAAMSPGG